MIYVQPARQFRAPGGQFLSNLPHRLQVCAPLMNNFSLVARPIFRQMLAHPHNRNLTPTHGPHLADLECWTVPYRFFRHFTT
jgi:hypothetical protein